MQTMDRPTLERCPYCGYQADLEWDDDEIWVECRGCYARGPAFGRGISDARTKVDAMVKAINGWNKRDNGKREEMEKSKKEIAEEIIKRSVDGNDGE